MDESSLAFRINEAEARKSPDDVCARTADYLQASNPYLVRPRFWRRLSPDVSKWVPCLPRDSEAEKAAIIWLRTEKRFEDALALTLGLMARNPKHLPTLDAGFSLSLSLRRFDSAEIFLEQRKLVSGKSAETERMRLSVAAARGVTVPLLDEIGAAVKAYPGEVSFRKLRLSVVTELARKGEGVDGFHALIDADAREIRLAGMDSLPELANSGLLVGQALFALHDFDGAEQQFKLAADWAPLKPQVDRLLASLQQARAKARSLAVPHTVVRPK